jgi:hypothetical protein
MGKSDLGDDHTGTTGNLRQGRLLRGHVRRSDRPRLIATVSMIREAVDTAQGLDLGFGVHPY